MAVERVNLLGGPALEGAHDVLLAKLTSPVQGRLAALSGDSEKVETSPYALQHANIPVTKINSHYPNRHKGF